MIAAITTFQTPEELQRHFLTIAAKIDRHARITFRDLRCPAHREDAVQECIALGWRWFLRLHERGKDIRSFTMVFVYLVVKAVRSGRRLTGMHHAKDVFNERCQSKHGFKLESLPPARTPVHLSIHGPKMPHLFEERLHDNHTTPVPDQVAFRMDWPAFYTALAMRDQQMVTFLSLGNTATKTAKKFGVSQSRIAQLRHQWRKQWQRFQEDVSV